MALPPEFLEELRARTPLASVIGRRVKLARSGRQWKGCCPFHHEKTPSFYVYDDHFHCFGCGAHGDAAGFVMQSQGLGFMEAVAELAAAAGIAVPRPSPLAAETEARQLTLTDILARAASAFSARLYRPEGAAALAYLRGRGLADATIARFGLGYAPGRNTLRAELADAGIDPAAMAEAGLLKPADEAGKAREFFFERVIFPIRDRRGRVIGFGGRALGEGQPKYLNGPETALFAKRRTLYGLDHAREAAQRGAPVLVVEGYMDVIALDQAGFGAALAPLGTALSAEQLELLWRLSPIPVLCFDGDAAGGRAAFRAAETALPLLAPDRTLRIARLPAGEDPDSLVRAGGAPAMQAAIDAALPLVDALYLLLREAHDDLVSPEGRTGFLSKLKEVSYSIRHRALAAEYRRALLHRFFGPRRARGTAPARPSQGRPAHPRPTGGPEIATAERSRILLAILLRHPALLADVEEALETLDLPPWLDRLREALRRWAHRADTLDSAALIDHLTQIGNGPDVRRALSAGPLPLPACSRSEALPAETAAGWWHIFGFLHRERLEQEFVAATRECAEQLDGRTERRLTALAQARQRVREGEPDGIGGGA